jgi:hypothetical protein
MTSREGAGNLPGDKLEPKPETRPRLFQTGAIRQLFRDVKTALMPKAPAPEPEPQARRKGDEDTGRAFRMTARQIMRRAARIPAEAYAKATAYLTDTLDWLNLCIIPTRNLPKTFSSPHAIIFTRTSNPANRFAWPIAKPQRITPLP